jgi:hypothetical protein
MIKYLIWAFACVLLGPLGIESVFGNAAKFPTFGITLSPPEACSFALSDSPGCVALYLFDEKSHYAGAAVLVEWMPANNADAGQLAQSLIKNHGGAVDSGTFTVGGEKAVKMSADFNAGNITHRNTYLAVHGKWAYMFSALSTATVDATKAVDAMLPTVKFSEPESPIKHVDEILDADFPLFDACTVRMPACVRKFDSEPKQLDVGINDLTTDDLSQPYAIDIEPIKTDQPMTFADIKEKFSQIMEKKYLPEGQHFKWHDQTGLEALHFTEPFVATTKQDDGPSQTSHIQICLLDVAPGSFIQLSIVIADLPKDQVSAYQSVSNKILASIKLTPKESK